MQSCPGANAILAAMGDGVYVVDRDRRITYWNAAATRITGYSAAEVVGGLCREGLLNHVDHSGRPMCGDRCPLAATLVDGKLRSIHVYVHHRDGYLKPIRVSAAPLRDDQGEIIGATETFSDDNDYVADRRTISELERLTLVDPLTGIGNRRSLDEQLSRRWSGRATARRGTGVLMIDIDHFKQVNDEHGHDVGDQVLVVIARSISAAVRMGDVVARFGGDEFVVVLNADEPEEVIATAERVRALVAQSRISTSTGGLTVSVSIGATLARARDSATMSMHRADRAMLRAKRQGRNRVAFR